MMMIDDFIGVFDNALNKEHCEELIKIYEDSAELNFAISRKDMGVEKIHQDNNLVFIGSKKYGVLSSLASHRFYDSIKIQKTKPAEGYHVWHCEHDNRKNGSRLLLVMVYLNDVEEGGETEFLYQSRRIKPKQGTMVICPSGFTHTHRGNPPLIGNKYMINGWIEFDN